MILVIESLAETLGEDILEDVTFYESYNFYKSYKNVGL